MATGNRFLQLLETGEATLEEAIEAIERFERELSTGQGVETRTCSFCGRPYVVSADRQVVSEQGRRSVCWRRACRQELRARGLRWSGHYLYQHRSPFDLRRH
jgi:hypothetical protein